MKTVQLFWRQTLEWHKLKPQTRIKSCIVYLFISFFAGVLLSCCSCCSFHSFFSFVRFGLGEVIYTTATTKPSAMPTNSLLRSSLSVNSRHHQRTTSGMTSSSSATSSNSNNLNIERHRDNSRSSELQKSGGGTAFSDPRDDDSPKDGHMNRFQAQNGKKHPNHCVVVYWMGWVWTFDNNLQAFLRKWTRPRFRIRLCLEDKNIKSFSLNPIALDNKRERGRKKKALSSRKTSESN